MNSMDKPALWKFLKNHGIAHGMTYHTGKAEMKRRYDDFIDAEAETKKLEKIDKLIKGEDDEKKVEKIIKKAEHNERKEILDIIHEAGPIPSTEVTEENLVEHVERMESIRDRFDFADAAQYKAFQIELIEKWHYTHPMRNINFNGHLGRIFKIFEARRN